ncbi:hypothetical protein EV421DRAFT_1910158 [Armillaria borealis]|uniref:Uncharacterized protein n=1 Tax=Armillaria borealis TaxID=47425 RepID=A0AA39MGX3_9AGAR|nr:hypothetical protein EV421DRAFT_1910158 [Armillaria borealis]
MSNTDARYNGAVGFLRSPHKFDSLTVKRSGDRYPERVTIVIPFVWYFNLTTAASLNIQWFCFTIIHLLTLKIGITHPPYSYTTERIRLRVTIIEIMECRLFYQAGNNQLRVTTVSSSYSISHDNDRSEGIRRVFYDQEAADFPAAPWAIMVNFFNPDLVGQIPTDYQGPSSSFGRPVFFHSITVGVVTLSFIAVIIIAPPLTTQPLLYSAKIQGTPPSSPLS